MRSRLAASGSGEVGGGGRCWNYLGSEWRTLDLRLLDATYTRVLRTGVPAEIPVLLKTPRQILKVVVYDPVSNKVGSRLVQMRN